MRKSTDGLFQHSFRNANGLILVLAILIGGGSIPACDCKRNENIANESHHKDDSNNKSNHGNRNRKKITESFKKIPAGSFMKGLQGDMPAKFVGEVLAKRHRVTLTHSFEIMATEMTFSQYEKLLGLNSYQLPEERTALSPIQFVSWYDAIAAGNKLSGTKSLKPCYILSDVKCEDGASSSGADYCVGYGGVKSASVSLNGVDSVYDCKGYRLPTAAEWEYAARAGSTTDFYNGEMTNGDCNDPKLNIIAWYCGNADGVQNVGQKQPNAWGLFDMSGNVWEWVWDWFENQSAEFPLADTMGPSKGEHRLYCGGAWCYPAHMCRSGSCSHFFPSLRRKELGFRLVRTL